MSLQSCMTMFLWRKRKYDIFKKILLFSPIKASNIGSHRISFSGGKKSKYLLCFTEKVCQVWNYPCNWNWCSCSRICQINLKLQFLILAFESGISKGFHAQFLQYLTSSFKIVLDMVMPMSKELLILWNIENKESWHSEKCRWHIWQYLLSISLSISSDE